MTFIILYIVINKHINHEKSENKNGIVCQFEQRYS